VAVSRPCLCTREDVARATDQKETARNWASVDRAIEAAADSVSSLCNRDFIPFTGTRYLDWPDLNRSRPWRLWLNRNEVISVTSLVVSGTALTQNVDYFLRRSDGKDEPPYTHIEINRLGSAALAAGQRSVALTGQFGHSANTTPTGALAEALDASETAVDVTNSAGVGVGDLLLVDSERMAVTDKTMLDTGVDIDAADSLTASTGDVSITLSTTTGAPNVGETILIDSERMLVVDTAGVVLTVKRAWDGSTLAAHTAGASIYAPRTLTVLRGAQGTLTATHSLSATVSRHVWPGIVRQLAVGEAIAWGEQEGAAWARTAGSGDNEREVSGRGLTVLRDQVRAAYGRNARKRAV
jgi:hypothetical protein